MKKAVDSRVKKAAAPRDKYFLKSLHQEIDLYDRKLADLKNYGVFATEAERQDAEGKLLTKRASLERTARELSASGVEFNEEDLPRSFREEAERESLRRAS
jgi:hypothetical protein